MGLHAPRPTGALQGRRGGALQGALQHFKAHEVLAMAHSMS